MDRPSKGSRTRNFIAAAVIGVALAGGGYIVGKDSAVMPPAPPPPEVPQATPEAAEPVIPEVLLQRADLIQLAAAASDALSGGPTPGNELAGRRFIVRIPFGCGGPAADDMAPLGWRYDAESKTLRVRVTPQDWGKVPWLNERLDGGAIEAIEGFWLPRPWTRSEACPAAAAGVVIGPSLAGERASSLGIAQFFGPDSSRVGQRRGRALEAVARIEPERIPGERGLHLVLEGRVAQVPGGQEAALCHAATAYDRPTCLISAEFERVAIENPVTQKSIADWRL